MCRYNMKGKSYCIILIITYTLCLACVRSRPLETNLQSLQNKLCTNEGNMSIEVQGQTEENSSVSKEDNKMIGSSPPSCEHKCYGCMPCEAIQVPTNTGRVGVQYTNYEPEGWKCKCGPALYTP